MAEEPWSRELGCQVGGCAMPAGWLGWRKGYSIILHCRLCCGVQSLGGSEVLSLQARSGQHEKGWGGRGSRILILITQKVFWLLTHVLQLS